MNPLRRDQAAAVVANNASSLKEEEEGAPFQKLTLLVNSRQALTRKRKYVRYLLVKLLDFKCFLGNGMKNFAGRIVEYRGAVLLHHSIDPETEVRKTSRQSNCHQASSALFGTPDFFGHEVHCLAVDALTAV